MASIFTFVTEPPRVSSPWSQLCGFGVSQAASGNSTEQTNLDRGESRSEELDHAAKLVEEPQAGPIEYKLHLLLRPRRQYLRRTTGTHVTGSQHARQNGQSDSTLPLDRSQAHLAQSKQSRQHRLQQLTTQLLWRLQQSGPHHSSSWLPSNPLEARYLVGLDRPLTSEQSIPGLEESHGALYEIGVSDDGSFVGLTKDELDESLETLRSMATSLRCVVHILRLAIVGSCEWIEESRTATGTISRSLRDDKLWAAEALVKPLLGKSEWTTLQKKAPLQSQSSINDHASEDPAVSGADYVKRSAGEPELLRVSLVGATTCGKSSILGTLSTATLDNGRGRSRLTLLKHRHEIASGLTSSVTQELIGYKSASSTSATRTEVINYASGNVSSWTDIHISTRSGRLLFISDSAGHPRYRRTTVRGLVGWAPHWAVVCAAADEGDPTFKARSPTLCADAPSMSSGNELSEAHLKLCLKLDLPLVVVLTKLDIASKVGLRQVLATTLSILKAAGRKPVILTSSAAADGPDGITNFRYVLESDEANIEPVLRLIREQGSHVVVPLVLTSAVQGTGITLLHALLHKLPVPSTHRPSTSTVLDRPQAVFFVEEVYALPTQFVTCLPANMASSGVVTGCVISGHLRYGKICVGDLLLLGPFSVGGTGVEQDTTLLSSSPALEGRVASNSRSSSEATGNLVSCSPSCGFVNSATNLRNDCFQDCAGWQQVRVVSIRTLRLPSSTLLPGQVGTIGLVISSRPEYYSNPPPPPSKFSHQQQQESHVGSPINSLGTLSRTRKGMVLAQFGVATPRSYMGAVVLFNGAAAKFANVNKPVVMYIASIRASARVMHIRRLSLKIGDNNDDDDNRGEKEKDENQKRTHITTTAAAAAENDSQEKCPNQDHFEITFHFLGQREWLELDAQVLVMPSAVSSLPAASVSISSTAINTTNTGRNNHNDTATRMTSTMQVRDQGVRLLEGMVGRVVRPLLE